MLTKQKIYLSVGLLSAAIIAFQLVWMQILSIVQWYHFAFMIISVALLGFGVAGTVLSLYRIILLRNFLFMFPVLLFFSGISMAFSVRLSGMEFFRFDTYLLFHDSRHIPKLLLTYLLLFIPFFSGALAIGLTFAKYSQQIGKMYFANLLGSGIGGIIVLFLMWIFFPGTLPSVIALLPVAAGFLFSFGRRCAKKMWLLAIVSSVLVIFTIAVPGSLKPSEFKSIQKALLLPGAEIVAEKTSPHGLVQVISAPSLRSAPAVSLNYSHSVPVRQGMFLNGDWLGAIVSPADTAGFYMEYTTRALPFVFNTPKKVWVVQAGTGEDMVHALHRQVENIAATQPNRAITSLLKKTWVHETDSLFYHPSVKIINSEPRTFLATDTSLFDLILYPELGAFGGTSGVHAFREQYHLTKESFAQSWDHLAPDGMLSISCWLDYPLRYALKILITLQEVLAEKDILQPEAHIVAVKSWGTLTFVVKKTPITKSETEQVIRFCHRMSFDPVMLGAYFPERWEEYNVLPDDQLNKAVPSILGKGANAFRASYPFHIDPATDEKPFFSRFIRLRELPYLSSLFGKGAVPFLALGYVLVLLTFLQTLVVAVILILLPLSRLKSKGKNKGRVFMYFGAIGLGYMFVEMVFIQQFVLYLGHTVYASAIVIALMMIFSGAGSYFSSTWITDRKKMFYMALFIAVSLLLAAFLIKPVLQFTMDVSFMGKLMIMILIVAPLAFLMGMPFPVGISLLSGKQQPLIPWAWGINGYFSVISTALATLISVELGFFWVIVMAAVAYGISAISA